VSPSRTSTRPLPIAALALVGFAANSLLARAALGGGRIDAASYTVVRLGTGALALALLMRLWPADPGPVTDEARAAQKLARSGRWLGGTALAAYAIAFSYSYLRIGAALGALVLFPTVKVALLGWGIASGEPPRRQEGIGGLLALAGLALLTAPGVGRPDLVGVALMMLAGLAWAVYTVAGRDVRFPLAVTAGNFARSLVIALPFVPVALLAGHYGRDGLLLATISGAIASGLSYVLWYAAVPSLTPTQAGLAQLAVPALAVIGAVIFLGEGLTARIVLAATTIFAGVAVALVRR
jgi:drug/metabolite transporter (DMT)-like permease